MGGGYGMYEGGEMYTRCSWVNCLGKLGTDGMILKCACFVRSVHLYDSCGFGKPMVHRVLVAWFLAKLS